jgi:hypothetical protein
LSTSGLLATRLVEAKSWWTEKEYKAYPTVTLDDTGLVPPHEATVLSQYGGDKVVKHETTGYFRTHFDGHKWVMVDPEGYEWIQIGMNSVRMNPTAKGQQALQEKFGTPETWAKATIHQLRELGFNMLANWSDVPEAEFIPKMPYVVELGVMQEFGKSLGIAEMGYGHHKYLGDVMPVFHPDFPAFCLQLIKERCTPIRDDPWLVGYFSDNELPLTIDVLDKYLDLPDDNVNREATLEWLARRNISLNSSDLDDDIRLQFLEHVVRTYFQIVSTALDVVDPNHLLMGCRFLGRDQHLPALWKGAAEHVDVISLNLYKVWTPQMEMMDRWVRLSGKPFFITEWYSKSMDTGMPNTGGAGWLVKTQADRAMFYENFTLGLLQHPGCVGWHYFKYMDNDPDNEMADASNQDANKGYVSNRYEPYTELTEAMARINRNVYWLRHQIIMKAARRE